MLDIKVIAYLRKNPDLLSEVIDRLLKGEEFDPKAIFDANKRKWGEGNEYDDRGRRRKKPRLDPDDLWNTTLPSEMRYMIMSKVLDAVRYDESSFIDLFILSLVCRGLRVDVLDRVKELETMIDVVPLYCRAAFHYYEDDDTFILFLDRLDSCAPLTSAGWKKILSSDYVEKFDELYKRKRYARDSPDIEFALFNNALDPIAALLVLYQRDVPNRSLFTRADIDKLKLCVLDTDLVHVMQSITPREYNGGVVDALRFLYYCARRLEYSSNIMKPSDELFSKALDSLCEPVYDNMLENLKHVTAKDESLVITIFNIVDGFLPRKGVLLVIRYFGDDYDWERPGDHLGISYYLQKAWFLKYLSVGTREALEEIIIEVENIFAPDAGRTIRIAIAAAIAQLKDCDFEALADYLADSDNIVFTDYYLYAARYHNEALLDFLNGMGFQLPLNHLHHMWKEVMTHEFLVAVNDDAEIQLRFFKKFIPNGTDHSMLGVYLPVDIIGYVGQPLYDFLMPLGDPTDDDSESLLKMFKNGNLLFKLRSCKTREDTINLLGIAEPLNVKNALDAFDLVNTMPATRKDSKIVAEIVFDHGEESDLVDAFNSSSLGYPVNMVIMWQSLYAPPAIFEHVHDLNGPFLLEDGVKNVLVFVEKWNEVASDNHWMVASRWIHAFVRNALLVRVRGHVFSKVYDALNLAIISLRMEKRFADETRQFLSSIKNAAGEAMFSRVLQNLDPSLFN